MYSMEVNERYDIIEYCEEDDEERDVSYVWKSYVSLYETVEEIFDTIKADGGQLKMCEWYCENGNGYRVNYIREFDEDGLDYVYGYVTINKKGGKLSIHDINVIKKVFGV